MAELMQGLLDSTQFLDKFCELLESPSVFWAFIQFDGRHEIGFAIFEKNSHLIIPGLVVDEVRLINHQQRAFVKPLMAFAPVLPQLHCSCTVVGRQMTLNLSLKKQVFTAKLCGVAQIPDQGSTRLRGEIRRAFKIVCPVFDDHGAADFSHAAMMEPLELKELPQRACQPEPPAAISFNRHSDADVDLLDERLERFIGRLARGVELLRRAQEGTQKHGVKRSHK